MLINQKLTSVEDKTGHHRSGAGDNAVDDVEERLLWTQFKEGDEQAFTGLYNRYVVRLYHYGERICGDHALIEDSVHDLFVDLWKHRETVSQLSSVKFYLYKGFKNRLVKNIQKSKKLPRETIDEGYEFEIVFSFESDLIAAQISDDQKKLLRKAVDDLSPRQREALTLRFFDELSYLEIASLMMLPVKSVYMLIYRAIDWLKQNLKIDRCFSLALFFI